MTTIDPTRIPRGGPAVAVVMRGIFALLAQALVAAGFRLRQHPTPWRAAAAWWMVHSSLADLGCLAVLRWLVHREGLRLRDLLGFRRSRLRQDVTAGLAAVAAQGGAGAVSSLLTRPFYPGGVPPLISIVRVPAWARVYSFLSSSPHCVATSSLFLAHPCQGFPHDTHLNRSPGVRHPEVPG